MSDIYVFFLASTVMALGIGLDAALAIFIRSAQLSSKKQKVFWVVGVSATHTLFPMLGYLLTYFGLQVFPLITPIIGIMAFILVAHFIFNELTQNSEDSEQSQGWLTFGLIMAVSWDALWSGPAKSAQVVDWSTLMIWLSFLWVGMLVSGLCILSCILANKVSVVSLENTKYIHWITWLQFSVIGYFGLLAFFRYTLSISWNEEYVFLLSALLIYILMKLNKTEYNQAIRA
ncbi:hypothetical protein NBRC116188_24460 [Oceaniserpentilla sp. 4NH20-0058]|uniref:hypothetical protein n=1 Tax=Oceaniserpentilla sp. 4NH20-0058 TaxID=3127660 RepID=UPI003108F05A